MNLAAEPQFPAKLPVKWPFPPAPPARRAWGRLLSPWRSQADSRRQVATLSVDAIASATAPVAGSGLTVRQMVVDILLVAMWGAMIPALMWLGAAAGF